MKVSHRVVGRFFLTLIILCTGLMSLVPPAAGAAAQSTIANRYIVVLKSSTTDSQATAATLGRRIDESIPVEHTFQHALKGFSATLTADAAAELAEQPEVVSVEIDRPVSAVAQTLPTGIRRIGADENSTAKIGTGMNPVSVNVAVIDTGSGPHQELNVVGGADCTGTGSYNDNNGHGTHVAGTIGAFDDSDGVVGVAPAARIWSVKVLDAAGNGWDSWVICGIDWVTANAASKSIRIANMSLGGPGSAGASCASSAMRQAICNSVNAAGVTYVTAAGNNAVDVSGFVPAAFPEVIAVAALNDTDGEPGGNGPSNDRGCDDCWASFSNYGTGIDMVAPGVDILSTWLSNGFATIDGTSMASPHVAGAAALYIAANGNVGPAAVRAGLQAMADVEIIPNNPINRSEFVLNVSDGWSPEPTPTPTATATRTATPTATNTATNTATATNTPVSTATNTPVSTATNTPVSTATNTPVNTATNTPVNTATNTPVSTATNTPIPPATSTNTATATSTPVVPTLTPTPTPTKGTIGGPRPTRTSTPVPTATRTNTPVPTATRTNTPIPTNTPTNTPVPTSTWTNTPVPTDTAVPTNTPLPDHYAIVRSGQSSNSNAATNAYDDNPGTSWRASGTAAGKPKSAYCWFDLGSVVSISRIEWLLATDGPEGFADGFTIQISSDGATWTTIATPGPGTPGTWESLPVNVSARYIQFAFTNPANATRIGFVAEVKFVP